MPWFAGLRGAAALSERFHPCAESPWKGCSLQGRGGSGYAPVTAVQAGIRSGNKGAMSDTNDSGPRIRVGGACGFWGESAMATPQLLARGGIDYLVYDYLAEITMSIMARARSGDPAQGYAADFVSDVLAPNLEAIAGAGVRVLSNAGGVNPVACGRAVEAAVRDLGLDLRVAVVTGDDLLERCPEFAACGVTELYSGAPFPAPATIASCNAYLGAAPVAAALDRGADIVITGRCADSALTLAACLHAFGWPMDDWDRMAAGSLAGHLLECGPQTTGGNFTDWREVAGSMADIGYPVAEISARGDIVLTKPAGTGGLVTRSTVGEQLLYEIEDPRSYVLPDVVCDFSGVTLTDAGSDRVRVAGVRGRPATDCYKVSATHLDGYRGGLLLGFCGFDAAGKARAYADAAFARTGRMLAALGAPALTRTSVEVIGAGDLLGAAPASSGPSEVVLKLAARHPESRGIGAFIRAVTGLALATPAGLSMFNAGRPRPQPVVRLFSFLVPKRDVTARVAVNSDTFAVEPRVPEDHGDAVTDHELPADPGPPENAVQVPLIELAVARSGDKGNRANIGVMARRPEFLPWIWRALTPEAVAERFGHVLAGPVDRHHLPGTHAVNFVLHDVLGGGGVASLRFDPQGKTYAQVLLGMPVPVPGSLVQTLENPPVSRG